MKNKHLIGVLVGAGVILVGLIIGIIGFIKSSIALIIPAIILLAAGAIVFLIFKKKAEKVCNACGASMMGCEYSYQEKSRRVEQNGGKPEVKVDVEINAICPKCGQEKTILKTFTVGTTGDNLQYKVDSFCKSRFGH